MSIFPFFLQYYVTNWFSWLNLKSTIELNFYKSNSYADDMKNLNASFDSHIKSKVHKWSFQRNSIGKMLVKTENYLIYHKIADGSLQNTIGQ